MSLDLKIQNPCDHIIYWERVNLQGDHRTFPLYYPLGSLASLKVRINNVELASNQYNPKIDPASLTVIPKWNIELVEPTRLTSPLIECRYTTIGTYCPKCLNIKYLDDIRYAPKGDFFTVADEFLLIQTFEKLIVTKLRSNRYHSWIGTNLHQLVSSKITDRSYVENRIKDDILKSSNDLRAIQQQYVKSGRKASKGELLDKLLSVEVKSDETDPTTLHVFVRFTAQSGKTLEYEQLLELSETRLRR